MVSPVAASIKERATKIRNAIVTVAVVGVLGYWSFKSNIVTLPMMICDIVYPEGRHAGQLWIRFEDEGGSELYLYIDNNGGKDRVTLFSGSTAAGHELVAALRKAFPVGSVALVQDEATLRSAQNPGSGIDGILHRIK